MVGSLGVAIGTRKGPSEDLDPHGDFGGDDLEAALDRMAERAQG